MTEDYIYPIDKLEEHSLEEHLDGISRRTIHFYTKEELIRKPSTAGGGARYHSDTLDRLTIIKHLQKVQRINLAGIREKLNAMTPEEMKNLAENIQRSIKTSNPINDVEYSTPVEIWHQQKTPCKNNSIILSQDIEDEDISWQRYILNKGMELHIRKDIVYDNPKLIRKLRKAFKIIMFKGETERMGEPQEEQHAIKYHCWSEKEHIFFETPTDKVLVDTGAPKSMGTAGAFLIGNEPISLDSSVMGTTISELSRLIEYKFTVLLGADILDKFDLTIDLEEGTITFSKNNTEPQGIVIPLRFYMGIPQIDVQAGGNNIRTFFDIGSRFSYIASKFVPKTVPVKKSQDFYPGMGKFEVDVYPISFSTGTITLCNSACTLPKMLELALLMGNASGITGSEFLDDYAVTLSKKSMTAEFRKLSPQ
jgi:DNA-binding transcriptional MerR regulator